MPLTLLQVAQDVWMQFLPSAANYSYTLLRSTIDLQIHALQFRDHVSTLRMEFLNEAETYLGPSAKKRKITCQEQI